MKYLRTPAILYDSIFYLIAFYAQNDILANTKIFPEHSEVPDLLERISCSMKAPPQILSPFFQYEENGVSVLSLFFSKNVDYERETLTSFTEKLRLRSDILYQDVIDRSFDKYENASGSKIVPLLSPSTYIDAINHMDASSEYKLQVALLLGNFAYAVEILIENLRLVYAEVEKLYDENAETLDKEYDAICTDESLDLLSKKLKYDRHRADFTTVSVTLLHQTLVYADKINDGEFLMLGRRYKEHFINSSCGDNAVLTGFIIACGSETRMKMLQGLAQKKEMTLSAFAKHVGSSPTTVIRNLRILEDSGVLCVSRREAQQIFYKINIDLLKQTKNSFNRFVDDLIN